MSEPNLKPMTEAELLKYLEEDFMPRLLPKLAKLSDYSAENARLKAEVERLEHQVKYWRIEAETDSARWLRTLAENEQLHKDYEALADEHTKLTDRKAEADRLKAEVERLRDAIETMDRESMSDEYDLNNQTGIINELLTHKEQMQGKIDRLTKAGDLLVFHYISLGRKFFPDDPLPSSITNWNAAKEGKPTK